MIIGYDGGYGNIKTSEGVIFPSRVSLFNKGLRSDANSINIMYNDKNYIVGKGSYETDLNKITKESSKIFLLTALALSSQEREFKVVAGLPIQQYKKQMSELKSEILSYGGSGIKLGESYRVIHITDVTIFPQCVASYYSLPSKLIRNLENSSIIIVDIGARTVDISLLSYEEGNKERTVTKYSTINEGILSLYSDFISELNKEFDLDLRLEEADKILRNGLYMKGIRKDLKFTKDLILYHVNEIFKELDLGYPIKTSPMLMIGGGSLLLGGMFKTRYNSTIIEDAEFSNSYGLKEVGIKLWQK